MSSHQQPLIAVIPWGRLGDGAIFLIIVENLRRAGFRVRYYSDTIYQMRHWLPHLEILPAPGSDEADALFADCDIVISDINSPLVADLSQQQRTALLEKTVPISTTGEVSAALLSSPPALERRELLQAYPMLQNILASGGIIRGEKSGARSMVDYTVEYCRDRCGVADSSAAVELSPPAELVHHRHGRRVAIFPTTESKKEYSPARFIQVAQHLARRRCEPHFIVLPDQVAQWQAIAGAIPVHGFESIDQLAGFLYESGVTLSNDSGGGHLSSLLGVPTVTIYRKRDYFEYRPGWGQGTVLRPHINPKILGRRVWMPFLRPARVAAACIEFVDAHSA